MKHLFSFFVLASLFTACTGNDAASTNPQYDSLAKAAGKDTANFTTLEWLDPVEQNLGKITQGASVDLMWKFRNTGTRPLLIESAVGGCGCTVVDKPQAPVAPGGEGIIKATFNSEGKEGAQHKEVYVMANNSNKNSGTQNVLKFTVEVAKKSLTNQ